jgi:hypothetical protein
MLLIIPEAAESSPDAPQRRIVLDPARMKRDAAPAGDFSGTFRGGVVEIRHHSEP